MPQVNRKWSAVLVTTMPHEILGWRTEQTDGTMKLTQLRLLETVVEPEANTERTVEQVRILDPWGV